MLTFASLVPVHDPDGNLIRVATGFQASCMVGCGYEVEDTDPDLGDVLSIQQKERKRYHDR